MAANIVYPAVHHYLVKNPSHIVFIIAVTAGYGVSYDIYLINGVLAGFHTVAAKLIAVLGKMSKIKLTEA